MNSDGLPSDASIELERTASNTRIVEVIFGIFGGFGLGWLYAGNIWVSIALLFFSFIYSLVVWSMVTVSFGLCGCLFIPLGIAIAFVSGNNARAWAMKTRAHGSAIRMLIGLAGLIIVVTIGVIVLGGSIAAAIGQINP